MSLNVSPDLLAAAERGDIDGDAFVATVRASLPYAWGTALTSPVLGAARPQARLEPDRFREWLVDASATARHALRRPRRGGRRWCRQAWSVVGGRHGRGLQDRSLPAAASL